MISGISWKLISNQLRLVAPLQKLKKKKIVKGNKENCLRKNRTVSQPGLSGGHPKGNVHGK